MLFDDYLSKLFLHYHRDMLRVACLYLNNLKDAEDIVGDCWVSALTHKEKLVEMNEANTRSYLMRCVANASIDFLRKKKRQAAWLENAKKDVETARWVSPEDQAIEKLMIDEVYQMLPWRESEIFILRMQGMSFSAIARLLGISSSTVRSYWWRVRQKLQKLEKQECFFTLK